jgi:hypothetical protein
MLNRVAELARSKNSPIFRSILMYAQRSDCSCSSLNQSQVIATPQLAIETLPMLPSNFVDFICPISEFEDWKYVLLEDLRLYGYNVGVVVRDVITCGGTRLTESNRPCTAGDGGRPRIIGVIFEFQFGALWGPDSARHFSRVVVHDSSTS